MVASRVCAVAGTPVNATPHARRNSTVQRGIVACFVDPRVVGTHVVGTRSVDTHVVGARSVGMRSAGTHFLPGGLFWMAARRRIPNWTQRVSRLGETWLSLSGLPGSTHSASRRQRLDRLPRPGANFPNVT